MSNNTETGNKFDKDTETKKQQQKMEILKPANIAVRGNKSKLVESFSIQLDPTEGTAVELKDRVLEPCRQQNKEQNALQGSKKTVGTMGSGSPNLGRARIREEKGKGGQESMLYNRKYGLKILLT